jgi:hypothetical protein
MDSYQLIVDIVSVENKLEEPYSILFNLFECNKLDFIKKLTTENETDFSSNLNYFLNKNDIKKENLKIYDSKYKVKLFINKFLNLDIKYIKSNNSYDIILQLIEINNKIIGIKLNQYYYINKNNLSVDNIVIDKKIISEWCKLCIKYNIPKSNELVQFNNIIINYENNFKKNNKEHNLDILPYINLYNSLILRYDIYNNTESRTNKVVTFLPVSRYTCKNLFIKYQNLFKIFESDKKMITFKNPKNEKYFNDGERIELVDTSYFLSLRLYCSKINNLESVYFRKTTEKLDLEIKLIVKKGKIIGIRFGMIDYYIWKKDGDLKDYETYNVNNNYHDFVVKIFKDACVFYFKL